MPQENQAPSATADTEKEAPAGSPPENMGDNPSTGGENNSQPQEKDIPFHKHPAWMRREQEWNDKFANTQKTIEELQTKLNTPKPSETRSDNIPSWFGGDEDAWKNYQDHQEATIKQAEERAIKRISEAKMQEEKLQTEATSYMQSEMAAIQNDDELNPSGEQIDHNKLLKLVIDMKLVDTDGRWNYRAGWAILQGQEARAKDAPKGDRKAFAKATTSGDKGESKPENFKTSKDFKGKSWDSL